MLIDLSNTAKIDESLLGGKAINLAKLIALGMPVPPCIVIPHHVSTNDEKLLEEIFDRGIFSHTSKFAVRSSGVGEDSHQNSFAGIFDTYLDVNKEEILSYIHKVRESADSDRSKIYSSQRNSKVKAMNVIIQHMVPAKFAGVVFTRNPIENDDRIGLLEIVAGSGEQLVSGKVTPTTIRYNKLTHQFTIRQQGIHSINDQDIDIILEELLPLLKQIEEGYEHAVDVEWVYGEDNKMYILQARPITT